MGAFWYFTSYEEWQEEKNNAQYEELEYIEDIWSNEE